MCVSNFNFAIASVTYFSLEERVYILNSPCNCFHVYLRGSSGPVLLLLHGGGHSALSWALFTVSQLFGPSGIIIMILLSLYT